METARQIRPQRTITMLSAGMAAALAAFFALSAEARAQVLYQQVFGRAEGDPNTAATYVNWATYTGPSGTFQDSGARFGATIRASDNAPTDVGNVNSSLPAASTTHGDAYVFRQDTTGTLFIPNATEQAAFGAIDSGLFSDLEFSWYDKRPGGVAYTYRLAVQVDSTWLVTASYASPPQSWSFRTFEFTTDTAEWYLLDFNPNVSMGTGTQTLADLGMIFPTGDITNFGFFMDGGGVTAGQFDTFTVAVPEPAASVLIGIAVAGMSLRRRFRKPESRI